ncbi:up-regulator of cell proliferation-like [Acipenser ruthenus]|uniref:up-regulator of cell proliferation-like n=1 Tax=Acipenser ruthenus TaxID=7906 RepID=UPI00274233FE|nr:up-regulator of cell proliferation-like [Acipenser ruthenus]
MVNVTARSTKCSAAEADTDSALQDLDSVLELIGSNDGQDTNIINPLDLITALFLCSDSFLQQEMMLKMSMCQFAVPLLIPDCSTSQCTLVLWAMRCIVKKFRPHSLADSKGFVQDSIVSTAMPMISFVRLGDCSLSKSQILNQVLSNPQQYHDVFIHRDMECGDVRQRIANGLVDISWYLPCGEKNLDIFPEPVAVAKLHGDLLSFQKQFSILCQTSSAVFIFFDSIAESECNLLSSAGNIKAQLFLVANFPNKTEKNINSLKDLASKLKLSGSQILLKKQQTNDAEFVSKLHLTMNNIMETKPHKNTIEAMSTLHEKVQHKGRVLVVTVLGVQSTGKSTLLNTMFGVQFAVSSGRCTRGAFMLLIRVKDDLKEELKCDFIFVIDTEGLKSPELAQLEDSYEHDNALATLVIGLSDITIINIAMENSTEMKDILQIVVHAS